MSSTPKKTAASAVALLAIVGAGAFGTFSAFTATTGNASNQFKAGTLALTDDDQAKALFNVGNLKPGDTSTRCIVITNAGSLPINDLKLEISKSGTSDQALAQYLDVKVERGATTAAADCAANFGTPAALGTVQTLKAAQDTNGDTGYDAAGIAVGQKTPYRFTITMPAATPDAAQGKGAQFDATWNGSQTVGTDRPTNDATPLLP
jgi:hypothetical protein